MFGMPCSPLVDLGIQNIHSILILIFFKVTIARKQGRYIGLGKNVLLAADVEDSKSLCSFILPTTSLLTTPL